MAVVTRFNKGNQSYVFTRFHAVLDRSTGKVEYGEHGGGVYYKVKNTGKFRASVHGRCDNGL